MRAINRDVAGDRVNLHLLSDLHIGSAYTDYARLEADITAARDDPNGVVAIAGDVFDMILPGDEKRFRVDKLHPRVRCNDVVNECLEWACDLLWSVNDKIVFISEGNHDNKVSKKHSFDPIRDLCEQLGVARGDYAGLLRLRFNGKKTYNVGYWHGHGGGATRMSAVKQSGRLLDIFDGLDACWTGHRHQRYACPTVRYSPTPRGLIERKVWLLMSGAYMRNSDYAIEALHPVGDMGSVKLSVALDGKAFKSEVVL